MKSARLLSGLGLLFSALIGLSSLFQSDPSGLVYSFNANVYTHLPLTLFAVIGAVLTFRNLPRGLFIGVAIYAIQVISFKSEAFGFFVELGYHFKYFYRQPSYIIEFSASALLWLSLAIFCLQDEKQFVLAGKTIPRKNVYASVPFAAGLMFLLAGYIQFQETKADPEMLGKVAISEYESGNFAAAAEHFEMAHNILLSKLGPDHKDTLVSVAGILAARGQLFQYQEIVGLAEQTVQQSRSILGADSTDTMLALSNLANIYTKLNRTSEAIKIAEEVAEARLAKLGPASPDTLRSKSNLCESYWRDGQKQKALELGEQTLQQLKDALGADHKYTTDHMNRLVDWYVESQQYALALPLQIAVVRTYVQKYGEGDIRVVKAESNLSFIEQEIDKAKR